MPYTATVLRVMIASPADVADARDAVEETIHRWNAVNARKREVVLEPWRWETSAVPVMGGHPQELVNAQGVDDSDIVIALFWGRLGSPTPSAVSGTAEEIDRALARGKPVHLYFSAEPLPNDVDVEQLEAVRGFKKSMRERGLLGEYESLEQLKDAVRAAVEHDIAAVKPRPALVPGGHGKEPSPLVVQKCADLLAVCRGAGNWREELCDLEEAVERSKGGNARDLAYSHREFGSERCMEKLWSARRDFEIHAPDQLLEPMNSLVDSALHMVWTAAHVSRRDPDEASEAHAAFVAGLAAFKNAVRAWQGHGPLPAQP